MRTLLLSAAAALCCSAGTTAQTVADFETLPLSGTDTFYVNFSDPGADVGFQDGLAYFPCVYDTGFGFSFWSSGFVYSSMTDSLTPGFGNQYSAITASGADASQQYVVAYGSQNGISLRGAARGKKVQGFYLTNTTYVYRDLEQGSSFSKKFGGASGLDPDWLKLTVKGFLNGIAGQDSVDVYLADFRPAGQTDDSIMRHWNWVNLMPLGQVDSLDFVLTSSDNGQFGMNTPAYFALDNFTTDENNTSVGSAPPALQARIFPNPAGSSLHIHMSQPAGITVMIMDMQGRVLEVRTIQHAETQIPVAHLAPGTYLLQLNSAARQQAIRFVKQ